jgi:hypothetical protein
MPENFAKAFFHLEKRQKILQSGFSCLFQISVDAIFIHQQKQFTLFCFHAISRYFN